MEARELDGWSALVTGGAQGIGEGICRRLHALGARVLVVDLDTQADKARALARSLCPESRTAAWIAADIATPEGGPAAVAAALQAFGGLDLLVNNAAPGRNRALVGRIEPSDWDVHGSVVLEAAMRLAEAARPHLARRRGAIVNISSVTAAKVAPDQCSWAYHASKAALEQLTRWMAMQLGPQGIRVNAVAPGVIDREAGPRLSDNPRHRAVIEAVVPLGRAGRARDIADAVAFLGSPRAAYITGQVLTVDGGLGLGEVFGMALRTAPPPGSSSV